MVRGDFLKVFVGSPINTGKGKPLNSNKNRRETIVISAPKRAMKILVAEGARDGGGPIAQFFLTASFHDNPDFPLAIDAVHVAENATQLIEIYQKEHPDVELNNGDDLGDSAFDLCR